MTNNPEITVLMPVKNGEKYIKEAIDSILKQSFTDFELLIMNDGSTDRTVEIIQSYTDPRIFLKDIESGLVENLNRGLQLSRGNYIARMDADDIMHSERLRIQIKRMKKNPEITVCGTWAKRFCDAGNSMSPVHAGYEIVENPVLELLKYNMMLHPSVMIKKSFLHQENICYADYPCVEDYKLWFDIAKSGGTLFVEPQELLFLRNSDLQVTFLRKKEMRASSIRLRKEILRYLLSKCTNPVLDDLFGNMESLEKEELISSEDIFHFFGGILRKHT